MREHWVNFEWDNIGNFSLLYDGPRLDNKCKKYHEIVDKFWSSTDWENLGMWSFLFNEDSECWELDPPFEGFWKGKQHPFKENSSLSFCISTNSNFPLGACTSSSDVLGLIRIMKVGAIFSF